MYKFNLNILPEKKTTSYMYHLWHFSMHAFTHEFFCNKIYLIRNLIHSHYHSDLFLTNFCWFFLAAGVFVSLNYADWMKKKWIKMIFPIVSKTYVNILRHSSMLCLICRFLFPISVSPIFYTYICILTNQKEKNIFTVLIYCLVQSSLNNHWWSDLFTIMRINDSNL